MQRQVRRTAHGQLLADHGVCQTLSWRAGTSRIDFGAFNHLSIDLQTSLLSTLRKAVRGSDAVILNQQVPGGISSPEVIDQINEVILDNPDTLFLVDARHHPEKYRGAVLKLNMSEAAGCWAKTSGIFRRRLARASLRCAFIGRCPGRLSYQR